jgi:hypothetical protein
MGTQVKWAAELAHVREVALVGKADLNFWKDRLLADNLDPAESDDGKAQIMIVGADAKFMGVRFRELSFSVLVRRPDLEDRQGAAYLARAFNSSRCFAFCERVFFATPYYHGDIGVSASLPASIHLAKEREGVFRVEMRTDIRGPGREPSRRGEEGWEGPVFLPERRPGIRQGNLFFARVCGQTCTYPFLPGVDSVIIEPAHNSEILRPLLDSHFVAREWAVRNDATHAKSKTYKRTDALRIRTLASAVVPGGATDCDSGIGLPGC